ncbi:MAG: TIGR02147 family protein [Bdellovibrionaceae bacterium]|jgi:hypothetical protein|nr:TIGR02147 family protein [Pseudobdellovibrionaceae bacterium]
MVYAVTEQYLKPHDILRQYYERKKTINVAYSLRALSRDLDLSPGFVSGVLSGKKKLPENRISNFIDILDMDEVACLQLKRALDGPVKEPSQTGGITSKSDFNFLNKYYPLEKKKYSILSKWYNIAILDLTTTKNFKSDSRWISSRLGISVMEVEIAIEFLIQLKALQKDEGGNISKVNKKLRLPNKVSNDLVNQYHQQMIIKALEELKPASDRSSSYSKRLVTGATVATSLNKINLSSKKINEFLYKMSEELVEDDPQEIYQLNIQLFPLTK